MMFAATIINAPIITEHISIVIQIAVITLFFIRVVFFCYFNSETFLYKIAIVKMMCIKLFGGLVLRFRS